MNRVIHGDYTRINRTEAKNRFGKGEVIYALPCKANPNSIWFQEKVSFSKETHATFGIADNEATYYNCVAELGNYLAYYKKEERKYGIHYKLGIPKAEELRLFLPVEAYEADLKILVERLKKFGAYDIKVIAESSLSWWDRDDNEPKMYYYSLSRTDILAKY